MTPPPTLTLTGPDGTRLPVRRTGSGVPVVLVHGSAGGLDSWDPVVPHLADRYELWTYARRGYAADATPGPGTFADDVADLSAVLAAAGGPAHVVGASLGGTVALHAARAGVPGIRSLTVFEPPLFAAGPSLAGVLGRYRALVDSGDRSAAARLFAAEVARVPPALLAALDAGGAAEPNPAEVAGRLRDLEAMAADEPGPDRWACVALPVLLVQGGDTWAPVPATMDALAAVLPDVTRVVLPGQSHFATHTAPAEFAAALLRWLAERDGVLRPG